MWQLMAAVRKVGPGLAIVVYFEELGDEASMMKFRTIARTQPSRASGDKFRSIILQEVAGK